MPLFLEFCLEPSFGAYLQTQGGHIPKLAENVFSQEAASDYDRKVLEKHLARLCVDSRVFRTTSWAPGSSPQIIAPVFLEEPHFLGVEFLSILSTIVFFQKLHVFLTWGSAGFLERRIPGKNGEVP